MVEKVIFRLLEQKYCTYGKLKTVAAFDDFTKQPVFDHLQSTVLLVL